MNSPPLIPEGFHWNAAGYAALSGPLARKYRDLDQCLLRLAADLRADDCVFPSLLSLQDLIPIRYLHAFPHLATFVTHLPNDTAVIHDFAQRHHSAGEIPSGSHFTPASQLLTPAACYHFYHRLADQDLSQNLYLTTCCACHRRESHYRPLERQWCFHMRELVCIGDAESVDRFLASCRTKINALVENLQLETEWQMATDPFFAPATNPGAIAQMVAPIKQELVLEDGLAIASSNRHGDHFGKAYCIRRNGEYAHSACVAFGLERWLAAFNRRYGRAVTSWPSLLEAIK